MSVNSLGRKPLGRPRGTQNNNIVIDLREAGCEGRFMELPQDRGEL
jgi:hypothetical protein